MAVVAISDSILTDIADAIRSKNGTENTYKPSQMPDAIEAISGGGSTPTGTIEITQNGVVDVTNYASADVDVPNTYASGDEGKVVSNGALVAQSSDTVTENDTYDTTLINSLTVNVSGGVTPTGTKQISITQNGTTTEDVSAYANAEITVNVPVGETIYTTSRGHLYTKNMNIQTTVSSLDATYFNYQWTGATELETVRLYGTRLPGTGAVMNVFDTCTKLTDAAIEQLTKMGHYVFKGCSALKNVQLGCVGNGIATMTTYTFYNCTQRDLTITIYVDDETTIPLANSPWGATNATIVYRSSTTGEVRTS